MHASYKEVLQYHTAHTHDTYGDSYWYYGHMWTFIVSCPPPLVGGTKRGIQCFVVVQWGTL